MQIQKYIQVYRHLLIFFASNENLQVLCNDSCNLLCYENERKLVEFTNGAVFFGETVTILAVIFLA